MFLFLICIKVLLVCTWHWCKEQKSFFVVLLSVLRYKWWFSSSSLKVLNKGYLISRIDVCDSHDETMSTWKNHLSGRRGALIRVKAQPLGHQCSSALLSCHCALSLSGPVPLPSLPPPSDPLLLQTWSLPVPAASSSP